MKIFPKLLIYFLVLSLLPITIITFFAYNRFQNLEIHQTLVDLHEISQSRIRYITKYFDDIQKSADFAGRTANTANALETLDKIVRNQGIDSKAYQDLAEPVDDFYRYFAKDFEVQDVYLINLEGKIVYTLEKHRDLGSSVITPEAKATQLNQVFSQVKANLKPALSGFKIYFVENKPVIFVGAPIFDGQNFKGVLVLQIPPNEIYKIFHDYTSLGETGETLIGKKEGNAILFLNPIRHNPDAAFKLKIPLGTDIALPMQDAVQGVSGSGISIDYRDQKIVAVWNYFEPLHLGIVVKIDVDEVLAPVNYLGYLLLLVGFGTFLIVVIAVIFITRALTKPMTVLRDAVKKVAEGNLDAKIDVKAFNEIGDLSRDFVQMIEKLKTSMTSIDNLNKEIEKTSQIAKAKEEQLSRISHELRTPLGLIQDSVDILLKEKEGPLQPKQKELVELAQRNAERLLRLVNDILSYQAMEKNGHHFNKTETDINQLLREVIKNYEIQLEQKKLQLQLKLADNLPKVFCDQKNIKTVVKHLITNAIKFTEKGKIIIESLQKDQNVQVMVRDTGIGIREEDVKKLFQGFRELDIKAKTKVQGVGLGLATSKKIIESHQGTIWAESVKGQGSSFYFILPIGEKS